MSEPVIPRSLAGKNALLAQRYARALLDLAETAKALDVVAGDLAGLEKLLQDSAEFRQLVLHPRLPRTVRIEALKAVANAAKLAPATLDFLLLLARNGRLSILGDVAYLYRARLAALRGEVTAQVWTTRALAPEQVQRLTSRLRKLAGSAAVHVLVKEDPALLGGLVVQMGSKRIDASLRGKLERLERRLTAQKGAA